MMNTIADAEIAHPTPAQKILGTKAETLFNLKPLLKKARISNLVYFTVQDWRHKRIACIDKIKNSLFASRVAVRSSSLAEDCWNSSNAGAFASLLNVDAADENALASAIDTVIASYASEAGDNQVLVQEMVTDVVLSGVLFTRAIDHDAPYYVVNYDDKSGQTDTVTSGMGQDLKTVFVYKGVPDGVARVDKNLLPVLKAAQEIEQLLDADRLDIEFALGKNDVYILQARPLVNHSGTRKFPDIFFDEALKRAYAQVLSLQKRQPYLYGDTTILGVMPDANPAELIGIKPRPLALSLYRHLITDDMFSSVRAAYGYDDVRPYPLMTSILGQPFVDTRVSFNSFTPAGMEPSAAEALISASLKKLRENASLHDKVEFEIVLNCWFPDIDQVIDSRFGFLSSSEKSRLVILLRDLTRAAIMRIDQDIDDTEPLKSRFDEVIRSDIPALRKAFVLLEDARRLGASPFVRLARSGFVAVAILKSLARDDAITQEELDDFMASLHTVSKQIEADAYAVKTQKMPLNTFVDRYGHLRPGTYDIMSTAYFEDVDKFLVPVIEAAIEPRQSEFSWRPQSAANIEEIFKRAGMSISAAEFDQFCRKAIEGREYGKFVYTKNMSYAIDHIRQWAEEQSLSRDDASFFTWSMLQDIVLGVMPLDLNRIKTQIDAARNEYALCQAIELPSLITCGEDIFAFERQAAAANFITSESVTSELLVLDIHRFDMQDLTGKIVLIPGADPGYDWLFSQPIAGLITMFGGANSHMAIRSSEQRLPAAIGVGQKIYHSLCQARTITLNCEGRSIKVIN